MFKGLILFGIGSLLWQLVDSWMVILALLVGAWVITEDNGEEY